MSTRKSATELLISLSRGDREALNELVPLVYDELRAIARRRLYHEREGHTLDTTALVHEAYLKLIRLDRVQWESRAHFLAIAAQAMRNILVSHARSRKRLKRGGGAPHVPLEEVPDLRSEDVDRILGLDAALERLAALNPRHARIVEYRFFGGMTAEETAAVLGVSLGTVKRDWSLLRKWLGRELESPSELRALAAHRAPVRRRSGAARGRARELPRVGLRSRGRPA
jgi:RNA polymerase sigma-70 factor, ECF subfamily